MPLCRVTADRDSCSLPACPPSLTPLSAACCVVLSDVINVITCDGRNIVVSTLSLLRLHAALRASPPSHALTTLSLLWLASVPSVSAASLLSVCLFSVSGCQGVLRGFDQTINVVLEESHERILSTSDAGQRIDLGLYLIRGDNVAVIGEMDEQKDGQSSVAERRAEPIKPVVH